MARTDRKRTFARSALLSRAREARRKSVADYFLNTSRFHRPWLIELAERYKSRGEFPVMAITLLPSYYESLADKEVAAFAALLITDNGKMLEKVSEMRAMLGGSPWEWFEKRMFVPLAIGSARELVTGGVKNCKIAEIFGRLWEACHAMDYEIPSAGISEMVVTRIGVMLDAEAKERGHSYLKVLTNMLELSDACQDYGIRLLLQFFLAPDGFSLGAWVNERQELKCPLTKDLKLFLQTWFPDYRRFGSVDEAIRLFGFERDCDFLYAYLGYKELQARHPSECSEKATRYLSWYTRGTYRKPHRWRGILPQIDF